MLNKEKYRDKIFEIAVNHDTCGVKNGEVRPSGELNCYECNFYSSDHCDMDFQKWANSGYKELEIDWSMVPVDTPVFVRNYEDEIGWNRRYFYKYHDPKKNNSPFEVFMDGATSWSADHNETTLYKYCKLAREEDIEKYRKR